jgi:hypothetical protein
MCTVVAEVLEVASALSEAAASGEGTVIATFEVIPDTVETSVVSSKYICLNTLVCG